MTNVALYSVPVDATQSTSPKAAIYLPSMATLALLLFFGLADIVLIIGMKIKLVNWSDIIICLLGILVPAFWAHYRDFNYRYISATYSVVLMFLLLELGCPLSYGMTALSPFPLYDVSIFEIDRLLGFDWYSFVSAIDRYPTLCKILQYSYLSMWVQIFFLTLIAAIRYDHETIDVLLIAMGVSLFSVLTISYFIPTLGVSTFISFDFENLNVAAGILHREAYSGLRDGSHTLLDFDDIKGLVTFPSYHASVAIISVLASRRIPYVFGCMVLLNGFMLISTITHGGHYLSDVIVGAVIGICSWQVSQAAVRWSPGFSLINYHKS